MTTVDKRARASVIAYCKRLPPFAPIGVAAGKPTAREAAQQVLPRVAALEHLFAGVDTPGLAAASHDKQVSALQGDLASLQEIISRALVPGGHLAGSAVEQAVTSFTAAVDGSGMSQCGIAG